MIEFPDDELDKLFRKSSEELDPQFDPEDWNKLKKRLDQQDGKLAGAWFRKWWPLALLLLLVPGGIASYFWFANADSNETKSAKPTTEIAASKSEDIEVRPENDDDADGENEESAEPERIVESDEAAAADAGVVAKNSKKPGATVHVDAGEKDKDIIHEEVVKTAPLKRKGTKISKLLPRSQSKAGGVYLEPNRSKTEGGDGALILTEKNNEKLISDSKGTNASELGARQAIGPDRVEKGDRQIAGGEENIADQKLLISAAMLANRPLSWKNETVQPKVEEPVTVDQPEVREKKVVQEGPQWAVRFGLSPDLSTVGLKDFTSPGPAVSLLVDYAILRRLYLQTGAIWSRKGYFGYGDSYELPKDPHYYGPEVKSVDGICKVLEIPVNLRYDLSRSEKSVFFMGAGVSSYHMNKERYSYKYDNENDPKIKYHGWQGKTGWYLLSHLNASVGYEYKLSSKLSLLAEPYVKIPLKRVGYGKVNLFTTGAWISVRYTPAFK